MKGIEGLTLGRYELRRRLAQGGMAEVYLAHDRRVRRMVAVKVLYGRDEPFIRRFEREALAVGMLSHDHILPVYDYGEQSPWYYLVMPYVEGGTLRDYLVKRKFLTLEEAASFLDQIASALQYAHDHGVVHRDVKPSNILLRPDGYAYLVDFGLAKAMQGAEALTSAGAMIGTPEYMAPEQSNGFHDYRSDIYSLGVILYQMLTGRIPFIAESPVAISLKHIQSEPPSPREFNSSIPESVEQVILKALEKDPNDRYQDALALATAYWQALRQEEAEAATGLLISDAETMPGKESPTREQAPITTVLIEELDRLPLHIDSSPPLFPLRNEPGSPPPETDMLPWSTQANGPLRLRSIRSILIALACVLVLVMAIPISHLWLDKPATSSHQIRQDYKKNTVNVTATAQAQATAALQATMAAQARTLVPAGMTNGLDTGHLLYAFDLKSDGGGWINDGQQCYFSPEGYHVQILNQYTAAWCYSNQQQFSNFKVLAQAKLLRGDIDGLAFRLNPATDSFYALQLNSKGQYRFIRAFSNNPQSWFTLIDWTYSNAIATGYGQTNTFFINAKDQQLSFYINGKYINDFSDSSYSTGFLGFFVGGDTSGGTEAIFSNMLVYDVH